MKGKKLTFEYRVSEVGRAGSPLAAPVPELLRGAAVWPCPQRGLCRKRDHPDACVAGISGSVFLGIVVKMRSR